MRWEIMIHERYWKSESEGRILIIENNTPPPYTGTSAENPVLSGCRRFRVLIEWKKEKKKTFNTGGGWGRLGQTTAHTEKYGVAGESSR